MEKPTPYTNKTKPEKGTNETAIISHRETAGTYTTADYKCLLNLSFGN